MTNQDGVDPICCLLMDDGGIPYNETLSWIQDGLKEINSVLNGEQLSSSWSREAWEASFTKSLSKIYSLYDESCFEEISTKDLKEILNAWCEFLTSKPLPKEKVFWCNNQEEKS